jgi:hypothetical protein
MLKAITTGDVKAVRDLTDADPKIATAKLISHKEDLVSIIFNARIENSIWCLNKLFVNNQKLLIK